ncbi:MAG: Sec-independent protein translocase protein TatB [Xanthobacteraceae bacterium]
MFDIGWSELVVIGVVALIVIGPKELPGLLRNIGQVMTKLRRMASEFQGQFQDALREAELDDLRKQAEKFSSDITSAASNPLEKATSEIQSMIDAPEKPAVPAAEPAPAEPPVENTPAQADEPKPAAEGEPAGGGGRAA